MRWLKLQISRYASAFFDDKPVSICTDTLQFEGRVGSCLIYFLLIENKQYLSTIYKRPV